MRNKLVQIKNNYLLPYYLWTEYQRLKGKYYINKYNDIEAINKLYFDFSGRYPDLENPKTFSEKLQWLKLNYHNKLMTKCADKYAVRYYIKEKGLEHILNELHKVYFDIKDFNVEELPQQFALKAGHGSGWNLIVKDKNKVNWFFWKKIINSWMLNNIYWPGREWPYKKIKPNIVVEKYLEDQSGQLMDYKFFCFNGKPHFVQANKGRGTKNHAQNFYDLSWKILPFGKDLDPRPDIKIDQPKRLEEMIEIARKLSADSPFVRVDLYEVNKKVYFGELTFFPASGKSDFKPKEYDLIIGRMLKLPSKLL